jgi:transaldolase
MNPIHALHELGQSIWYDNIQRRLIENGVLASMIDHGDIRGITSNPSIFNNAIAKSNDYDAALLPLAQSGLDSESIFFNLAADDIRKVADLFSPLYQETNGEDGYVSLEVSPFLAKDTSGTITQAKMLRDMVQKPNLMVKIPATREGLPAIRQVIAAGINVNVTLIFSLERYAEVMNAYMEGLEERQKQGLPIDKIASVASFFVSRLDTKVDAQLENLAQKGTLSTQQVSMMAGKTAIAQSRMAYYLFEKLFASDRFVKLQKLGAKLQRPLWASTSTKNPAYRDVMYIEELIAPHTVNTVPPATLDLFRDHGDVSLSISGKETQSQETLQRLEEIGISLSQATQELEDEGVKAFSDAFNDLLNTIHQRSETGNYSR